MPSDWHHEFDGRMRSFATRQHGDGIAISVKVRVVSGCFHREHSPRAYALIDRHLGSIPTTDRDFEVIEHESGPEVLTWVEFGMAAAGLAVSVISLVVSILQARRAGVKAGDHPSEPLEVIVRRTDDSGFREEIVLRIGSEDRPDREAIEGALARAVRRIGDPAGVPDATDSEDS